MEEPDIGQEDIEDLMGPQEDGPQDQIGLGMGAHPITGEPLIVVMVRDKHGRAASVNLNASDAVNLGGQLSSQGTVLSTLIYMARSQAQAQANGGGNRIILPGN